MPERGGRSKNLYYVTAEGKQALAAAFQIHNAAWEKISATTFLEDWTMAEKEIKPLALWILRKWLGNFAYRIDLEPGFFFMGSAITIVIALASISILVIKAAIANPIESLRYE